MMDVREIAQLLWTAASGGSRPDAVLAQDLDEAGAYAVQDAFVRLMQPEGCSISGYKIALTSAQAQARFHSAGPVYGRIPGGRCFSSGAQVDIPAGAAVGVECELAVVLGRDICAPPSGREELLACVACGLPALELVSSRFDRPHTELSSLIADNGNFFAAVLGDSPVSPSSLDTGLIGLRLEVDGAFRLSGVSAAVLGDPLDALNWLIRKLCAQGRSLRRGDLVLTGAFAPAEPAAPGACFQAGFDGLGSVSVRFAPAP